MYVAANANSSMPSVIVGTFLTGILLTMTGGFLVGSLCRACLSRGKLAFVLVTPLALLNLGAFAFLGKPVPMNFLGDVDVLAGAGPVCLAAFFTGINGYLIGNLMLPKRLKIPSGTRIWLMFLLYGSIFAGGFIGFHLDIWRMGTVPFSQQQDDSTPGPEWTWQEALATLEQPFPPECSADQTAEAEITLSGPTSKTPRYSTVREVINATGPVVTVQDQRFEVHGYAMIPPSPRSREKHGLSPTYWRLDGRPWRNGDDTAPGVPNPADVEFPTGKDDQRWHYSISFVVSLPEKIRNPRFSLTQFPQYMRGMAFSDGTNDRFNVETARVQFPIAHPAEFWIRGFLGQEKEYSLPAREGTTLRLGYNRVLLARLYPWPYSRVVPPSSFVFDNFDYDEEVAQSKPHTTAVFFWQLARMADGVRLEAILDDGKTVEPVVIHFGQWWVCDFSLDMSRIDHFRIQEIPGQVEVRFPIPKLRGLPPQNEDCKDKLDLWYPFLAFSQGRTFHSEPQRFLRDVLGYDPDSSPDLQAETITYENITVRELLDSHYPQRWWIRDGQIHATQYRWGTLVRKVNAALNMLIREDSNQTL